MESEIILIGRYDFIASSFEAYEQHIMVQGQGTVTSYLLKEIMKVRANKKELFRGDLL